jgi:putative ABC transport system substrate-binding protein
MNRRTFIAGLGSAAVWPVVARAQQAGVRRIGVLMGAAETELDPAYLSRFWNRLEALGWKQDRNIATMVRWWTGGPSEMRPAVGELTAFSPDVVMVFSNLALALLKSVTTQVPIVFVGVGDPIGDGFISNLSHPGGNITGFAANDAPMGGKWLQVLKEAAPHLTRVATIFYPDTPIHRAFWHSIETAAPRIDVEVTPSAVRDAAEIEKAIKSFAVKENGGIIVLPHAVTWTNEALIIALSSRFRLPSIYATDGAVKAGGFVFYGMDYEDSFRRTAEYVDRILRGEKPGDLPVQQPVKFKLAVNLKTAKTLGVTVPQSILLRADEVIE